MRFAKLFVAVLVAVVALVVAPSVWAGDSGFNPGVSLDIGYGAGKTNDLLQSNEVATSGLFAGLAFTGFGDRVRAGGAGVAYAENTFVVYTPVHALILGSPDCGVGYGSNCSQGGLAFYVNGFWAPNRHNVGIAVGLSLVGARGRRQ